MAVTPLYLVDKSALEQRRHSEDARRVLERLLEENALASCHLIALEVLYSARNLAEYDELAAALESVAWIPVTEAVMDRTLDVQHRLAERGQHRTPLPDLIIAATAELNDAVLLHYDSDFDLIAEVTGQPARWIAPRGSVGRSS